MSESIVYLIYYLRVDIEQIHVMLAFVCYHMHTFKIHDSIVFAPIFLYIVVAYCNLYLIVAREKKKKNGIKIIIIMNV